MKILVIGSGGREHTLVWKLAQSPRVEELWCSPGNAGIGKLAQLADLRDNNIAGLLAFAEQLKIDLTVVGPEAPLSMGIVDAFRAEGLRIFGPDKNAAEIESSKIFSKRLMKKYDIPTARFEEFDNAPEALAYVRGATFPLWIKADGLAAGKGAIVARSKEEAEKIVNTIMVDHAFGPAGQRIIIEEEMHGQEATVMAFAAGTDYFPMPPAQDHKPIFDGDQGPNTGGMGCYSPVPAMTPQLEQTAQEKIIGPILKAMAAEGRPYYGILYTGLMLTEEGLKVVEFNCRFGDPEAEVILPRLESDLVDLLEPIANGKICDAPRWSSRAATCVVMASGGYPDKYEKGKLISGLEEAGKIDDAIVFHAATLKMQDGFHTNGGRVLSVTGLGDTLEESVKKAYEAVEKISWEGAHYRRDIASKAISRR